MVKIWKSSRFSRQLYGRIGKIAHVWLWPDWGIYGFIGLTQYFFANRNHVCMSTFIK